MASPCIASQVEVPVEKKPIWISEPRLAAMKQRVRDLLVAIFEGREEFLGWTPD